MKFQRHTLYFGGDMDYSDRDEWPLHILEKQEQQLLVNFRRAEKELKEVRDKIAELKKEETKNETAA